MTNDNVRLAAGSLVRLARARSGMSQAELARRANTSQQAIGAYEAGTRQPSLPTLWRILAGAGFEPRIRLEPLDDHDASIEEWEAARPANEIAEWAAFRAAASELKRGPVRSGAPRS